MSSPIISMSPSGQVHSVGVQQEAGVGVDERSPGVDDMFPHAEWAPMHEEREDGGSVSNQDFEELLREVGDRPLGWDSVGPDVGSKSGGPSQLNIPFCAKDSNNRGLQKIKVGIRPRRTQAQNLGKSPPEPRPKKRIQNSY
ncbi:hypothetical protein Hanom_Chr03g00200021 [Helianthus anomalus]